MASIIVQQLQSLAAKYTVGDELEEDTGIMWEAADRIEKLEACLAEPEGEQEGRVIEWLCKRGYVVTKGEQK